MAVKNLLCCLLSIVSTSLIAPIAHAQQVAHVATHIDSLRAARDAKLDYEPITLTFTNGKQVKTWLGFGDGSYIGGGFIGMMGGHISCFQGRIECYETNPEALPRPVLKAVSVERLKMMDVTGPLENHRFEALKKKGKPIGILAENLAKPGPMELFGYTKTKNDMLIPVPLPYGGLVLIPTGTHEKYYWYVRLAGGDVYEVPNGNNELAYFMGKMCQAAPDLVDNIRRKDRPYRSANLRQLVDCYNETTANR